jgi:hypothetical protein
MQPAAKWGCTQAQHINEYHQRTEPAGHRDQKEPFRRSEKRWKCSANACLLSPDTTAAPTGRKASAFSVASVAALWPESAHD